MKKVLPIVVLMVIFATATTSVSAQNKLGHVDIEHVVGILPDIKKADSLLQIFKRDSIENALPYYISEYQRKDSIAKAATTPAAIKQTAQQEANQYLQMIQNWDQVSQMEYNRKSQEVLGPYFSRAYELINTVAKENGYAWVFKQDALMVAPQTDDLLPLIAKKLGVTLPAAPPAAAPANR